jgi:hypothetical protein
MSVYYISYCRLISLHLRVKRLRADRARSPQLLGGVVMWQHTSCNSYFGADV